MNNTGKGSLAGTAVSNSTIGNTDEADALESITPVLKRRSVQGLH